MKINIKETNLAFICVNVVDMLKSMIIAITTCVLIPLGIVLWLISPRTKDGVWMRWFAWRPVKITASDRIILFKTIERCKTYDAYWEEAETKYRIIKEQ